MWGTAGEHWQILASDVETPSETVSHTHTHTRVQGKTGKQLGVRQASKKY